MNTTIKAIAAATNVGLLLGLWLNDGEGITSQAGLILLASNAVLSIFAIAINKTKRY
jgi:hypothetical protein